MTTKQIKKIERIAEESARYARKAIAKSNELYVFLSLLEAKSGKVKLYSSVNAAFKKLRI